MWEVVTTPEFDRWFDNLKPPVAEATLAAAVVLSQTGPVLGRPLVDRIHQSEFHNMKELRPKGPAKTVRVLFIFDPTSNAVLLLGGDKQGAWNKWYRKAIPAAEANYRNYLDRLKGTDK